MNKFTLAVAMLTTVLLISSCVAPDSKTYENEGSLIRNECGAFSSEVRTKRAELRDQQDLIVFTQKKRKIYELKVSMTRGGPVIYGNKFSNDAGNELIESRKIRKRSISGDFHSAVDGFYDQPNKHQELDQRCLFKGVGI
ncbi:hypothetical protein [Granulosicoccus antarcticus]|uniref:Lipoprotein n=1 Tax=Granulosicoccus antarcticus IMCC3135 TaxID=1192854 RepID=A0A2Z2NYZ8_9GAMM|nr:hypothetical protein [Granulosicoccus antarcticus]ASJ76533.1 hypothetical protein IMCC3135_32440 [Granulosicoccus antarcticus IMCC3135]